MSAKEDHISFCITLCSRKRPILLHRALSSLCNLTIPENTTLSFLVVENNESAQYADIFAEFSAKMALTHVLEPRPGLTFARNKILDTLCDMEIDWMGGVDDDQIIDPDWAVEMVAAIRRYPETKTFVGHWRRTAPKDMIYWHPTLSKGKSPPDGAFRREGVTTNTAIHNSVFTKDGMGLRYDMEYNFLGGEGTDFGEQYFNKGGKIRYVPGAKTVEEIHEERISLKARLNRAATSDYILAKVRHLRRSPLNATLWSLQIIYRSAVFGVTNLAAAGVAMPFNKRWAMIRYGQSLRYFAKIKGVLRYYFGNKPEQYREIDGK